MHSYGYVAKGMRSYSPKAFVLKGMCQRVLNLLLSYVIVNLQELGSFQLLLSESVSESVRRPGVPLD